MLCTYFVGSHPAPSFSHSGRVAIAVVIVPERGLPEEHVEIRRGLSMDAADWESVLLGLSAGRDFGFKSLPIQCSRKRILRMLESQSPAEDKEIEGRRQKALELSKRYESVRYLHCRSESNPAINAARRFFQGRTFRIVSTLTGRQTLCIRARSSRHAEAIARTEFWPPLDQLVRFEGLHLDDIEIQDVTPVGRGEFEIGATIHLRFELPIEEECLDAAEERGGHFTPQIVEVANQYGLEDPRLSLWSAYEGL